LGLGLEVLAQVQAQAQSRLLIERRCALLGKVHS
jgi:hypothetical protein